MFSITVDMKTIRDFADEVYIREWDHTAAGVVRTKYSQAGYLPVKSKLLGREGEWQQIHAWCREHVGEKHYSWTGSTFWFESEQDAALFALRWA